MPVIPYGEFRPDVSDYNGSHTQRVENVFPRGDGYGPVANLAEYTGALGAACRGAFVALKSDGTIRVFAGTATKLYLMDNTALTFSDVSRLAGGAYSLSANDQWQFAQLGDVVLATQKSDVLQAFTMGSSANFAASAGSPPQAAYITTVNQFVVLSGLNSTPNRIQWSSRSNSAEWTAGTNEGDVQDFTDGGVVRGVAGGEFGLVFHDNAIRSMIYQPGSAVIFSFERIAEGKGLRNPYSLVKAGDRVFFRSAAGFEMIVPGSPAVSIGKERFDRFVTSEIDTGALNLLVGAYEPESSRVYWTYKSTTGAAGLFNRILVWDFALERATLITGISGEYIAQLGQPGVTLEGLDSVSSSIDALSVSFDDIPAAFGVQLAMFSSAHKAGFLSGANLEAILETAEFGDGNQRSFVRGARHDSDAPTIYGSILTRDRLLDNATTSAEAAPNAIGYTEHRKDTRLVKYRTRVPASTVWNYAIGVEPDAVATGQK